jgi:parallel beta-helix repeat protein
MRLPTIRSLFVGKFPTARPAGRKSPRLRLERLEERAVPSTLTVDDNRAQNRNAQFTSIQDAVNHAAAGDTIKVYAGDYREQVTIPSTLNNLRLVGVGGKDQVVIDPRSFTPDSSPGSPGQAIVRDSGARNVEISGFFINGGDAPTSGTNGSTYGILVDNGGSAFVHDDHVALLANRNQLAGNQSGVGISFGLKDYPSQAVVSSGSGEARNNFVERYEKAGILVAGSGSFAKVSGNTVKGFGLNPVIAQNGIQVSNGASAEVTNNTVSNNQFQNAPNTPPDAGFEAEGILVDGAGANVRVRGNFVFANDEGIALFGTSGAVVENNTAKGNSLNGILLVDSDNNTVRNDDAEFNQADGIGLASSNGNTVVGNTAAFNGDYGIEVDSASTGNTVRRNRVHDNGIQDLFVDNTNNTVGDNQIGGQHHNGHHGHHPHHRHHGGGDRD